MPRIVLSKVLFPAPFGPMIPTSFALGISKWMSQRTDVASKLTDNASTFRAFDSSITSLPPTLSKSLPHHTRSSLDNPYRPSHRHKDFVEKCAHCVPSACRHR